MCPNHVVVGFVAAPTLVIAVMAATVPAQGSEPDPLRVPAGAAELSFLPGSIDPFATRINVDVQDAPLTDVFGSFRTVLVEQFSRLSPQIAPANVHLVVADGLDAKVTICLRNVSLRTALTAVCESVGCRVRTETSDAPLSFTMTVLPFDEGAPGGSTATFVSPAPPESAPTGPASLDETIQLRLKDAEAGAVLGVLSRVTELEVTSPSELATRLVTLDREAPLREILDVICDQIGCRWSLDGQRLVFTIR